jgi:hypothetical protein
MSSYGMPPDIMSVDLRSMHTDDVLLKRAILGKFNLRIKGESTRAASLMSHAEAVSYIASLGLIQWSEEWQMREGKSSLVTVYCRNFHFFKLLFPFRRYKRIRYVLRGPG